MKPLPSIPPPPLPATPPLSEKSALVTREDSAGAASRAAGSERIQAVDKRPGALPSNKPFLDQRACAALGVAFGLGILVGYCAADRR